MDIYNISATPFSTRPHDYTITPNFKYDSNDLACKGGDFFAYWDGHVWQTSFKKLCAMIDRDVLEEGTKLRAENPGAMYSTKLLNDHNSNMMTSFKKFLSQFESTSTSFNNKILFSDDEIKREDYVTTTLTYSPSVGETPAFDEMMDVLYLPEELDKILWFMGALLCGDMSNIQKFLFLYGGKGTGKGTVLKIFKLVFQNYHGVINLKTLTSGSSFATSEVKELPLLIDDDCDISAIKDDTVLLKLTSHEPIRINEKYKQQYEATFNGLLIAASNERFKVKHVDSGITRRAVVAEPTNEIVPIERYHYLMKQITFEIPHIAERAMRLYKNRGIGYYENYVDIRTIEATDHMFSFIDEYRDRLGDPVTLSVAAALYKEYLDDIGFDTNGYKRKLKQALMKYYGRFAKDTTIEGVRLKNVYSEFKDYLFTSQIGAEPAVGEGWIKFDSTEDVLKHICGEAPAQLANDEGNPKVKWENCEGKLNQLDTSKLHFVRLPLEHIVIDFDLKVDGEKNLEANIKAANQFPPTYCEVSKSGQGLHLHYMYDGDVSKLSSLYDIGIEIKVFKGLSSLRRKYTSSNSEKITIISTGLPLKEETEVYNDIEEMVWTEQKLRTVIERNLRKEYHNATKPSIDFIFKVLTDAYVSGLYYDVSDMQQDVLLFAMDSSNQADYCMKLVADMHFSNAPDAKSAYSENTKVVPNDDLWFYDVEVYQNVFIVVGKQYQKEKYEVYINPTQYELEGFLGHPLVGFNNLRYDNHIMYGALMGEDNQRLYQRSQDIINNERSGMNNNAYNLSYLDVYEMSTKKQSLKKWEAELDIKHDEMDWPWDKPLPEELWDRAVEYCKNDVYATEQVFDACDSDYDARCILAELSGLSINSTTQQHTAEIIFEGDKEAYKKFVYTDLSTVFPGYEYGYKEVTIKKRTGEEITTKKMVSSYMGEDPSEGGYVYSEPGVYEDVWLLDIESQHPTSLIEMNYFGPYTQNYADLKAVRLCIKHGKYDEARELFGGRLKPYLKNVEKAEKLSYALKIPINIVYGMTSASFQNPFKHPDNVDNIVAKRGALFMITLKNKLQAMGQQVVHIKTDSIKVPSPSPEIVKYIYDFGKEYGYTFDHEHTYKRMALVNRAVYIAELEDGTWEPTGSMFAEPFVYKKLFSHENLEEKDFFQTKTATAPIYLGDDFVGKVAKVYASHTGQEMLRVVDENNRSAVTGTKGYNWRLASEYRGLKDVDMSYYDDLTRKAIEAIDKVGRARQVVDIIPAEYEDIFLPF